MAEDPTIFKGLVIIYWLFDCKYIKLDNKLIIEHRKNSRLFSAVFLSPLRIPIVRFIKSNVITTAIQQTTIFNISFSSTHEVQLHLYE